MSNFATSTTARNALAARRQAHKKFIVRPLTKKGVPSKAPITAHDMQLDAFAEHADAEARVLELQAMNPHRRYAVVDL